MAVYKIFPEKDATLYSMFPIINTGIDEIVESTLTTFAPSDPNPQVSRFVTKFSDTEINNVFSNIIPTSSAWISNLRCFNAKVEGLMLDTTLDIFAVSQSWGMGTGRYLDDPLTTNGTSWVFRTYSGSNENRWDIIYTGNSTGSYNLNYAPAGGGTWYIKNPTDNTYLSSSQVFTYAKSKDLNVDVTPIVDLWVSSSLNNDGFIIKQKEEWVYNKNFQPEIKFFSVDTHTIYPPQLEFKWDDFTYNTGSTLVLSTIGPGTGGVYTGINDGTYTNISLTGSLLGTGAIATVVLDTELVTSVTVTTPGSGFVVGELITFAGSLINDGVGGSGTQDVTTLVDSNILSEIKPLDILPATVNVAQNPGTFYTSSINEFRINSRPEYPIRVWQTASLYTNNYALPTASYWALKDLDTNEYVIDFDTTFTKLSCDVSGSYFTLHMNGLQPERYYQILIQSEIDGSTVVYDDEYYFKVING